MPVVESLRLGDMSKGDPIPEGTYHVRIASFELKEGTVTEKNKDPYPYFNASFTVMGGSPEEFHGRRVFDMLTLSPAGNFRLRQLAVAIFGEDEDLDVMEAYREGKFQDAELVIAAKVQAEGRGKDGKWYEARNQVSKYLALQA